jgi:uncharacterized protein
MENSTISLSVIKEKLAVCRLEVDKPIPGWAMKGSFYSISKTNDELSLVCLEQNVPRTIKSEKKWRAIKVEGMLDFSQTGILASLAVPLAEAKISIFALSTFDTDYILVKSDKLKRAIDILKKNFDVKI